METRGDDDIGVGRLVLTDPDIDIDLDEDVDVQEIDPLMGGGERLTINRD